MSAAILPARTRPFAWTFLPFIERKCHKGRFDQILCRKRSLAGGTKRAPIFMRIRSSLITCGAFLGVQFPQLPIKLFGVAIARGMAPPIVTRVQAPQHDSSADLGHDLCASDVVPRDLVDVQRADLPHDRGELVVHDLEHAIHAGLAERR
jgi:hypothetical protein